MDDSKAREALDINITTCFETLPPLPCSLHLTQCVTHNNEILICAGDKETACYSYHTQKNQYKHICFYPDGVELGGHCIVKCVNDSNPNYITLLSFGGAKYTSGHTLVMKYVSVWDKDDDANENECKTTELFNQWIPLVINSNEKVDDDDDDDEEKDSDSDMVNYTYSSNDVIHIGRSEDDYYGVRALIAGSNNHLLFVVYYPGNIDVIDLNTFEYVKQTTLPIDKDNSIRYPCFVLKTENGLPISKDNKKIHEMMLFYWSIGFSIEYNEDNNSFQFHNVPVCTTLAVNLYGYVCVSDCILFFGGNGNTKFITSEKVHKYSMKNNTWMKFEQNLPFALNDCFAILNEADMCVHIFGRQYGKRDASAHIKTKVDIWMREETQLERQLIEIDEIKRELNEIENGSEKKEVEIIIDHWIGSLFTKSKWIDELNDIILSYILVFVFYLYSVCCIRFSPDGTKIVSSSFDNTVQIWDVRSGEVIKVLKEYFSWINDAQFSPDGNIFASCSWDKSIRLWSTNLWTEIRKLGGHIDWVTKIHFSSDGKTLVSGSYDRTIRIWDIESGQEIKRIGGHSRGITDVQFSPNDQQVVSASNDETIRIWDVNTGEMLKELKGHSGSVVRAQFSPNGQLIVSASKDETIRIWNAISGVQLKKLLGHSSEIRDVKFFPSGQTIVSCSYDSTVRIWDLDLEVDIQILKGQNWARLDITSNGNTIASSSHDGTIRLWKAL
ncbi:WD-40 repeat protein [Reticulomyxa filosa]|uniref:WD-40 repeat protein n=1 Tax=Reticulomyxa filosa TaxID=46433 RepID=X6PF69_RETFI|nr:WD-40 repeat protein [Reticulomyxa filosa]|eukprot:ETO36753.1 WD-40 repeat protein [Reticulomyxa filosa]